MYELLGVAHRRRAPAYVLLRSINEQLATPGRTVARQTLKVDQQGHWQIHKRASLSPVGWMNGRLVTGDAMGADMALFNAPARRSNGRQATLLVASHNDYHQLLRRRALTVSRLITYVD